MRKIQLLIVTIGMLLLIASCSGSTNFNTISPYSPRQIVEMIIAAQAGITTLHPLYPADDSFAAYLSDTYQLQADSLEDGMVTYPLGVEATEIAVFLLADSAAAAETEDLLLQYKEKRQRTFTGYAPLQATMAEKDKSADFDKELAIHAWNMVCLDSNWYCVDVTWDDPLGLFIAKAYVSHTYFNVTSQFLKDHDHQWDESAVPEAAAARERLLP